MELQRRIKMAIDVQNKYGKYFSQVKEFNSQKHFENWANQFEKRTGAKIVGSQTL
jgi:hypothetical protein